MAEQPANMPIEKGVHLTVGCLVNGDRVSMVMALVCPASAITRITACQDAVISAQATLLLAILDCMATDTNVTFLQAEGMADGMVPYRMDFAVGSQPGTGTAAGTLPSQVAGLIIFYQDPADATPGARMKFAKTFVPGIPRTDVLGDIVNDPTLTKLQTLADTLQGGFASVLDVASKWYRVIEPARVVGPPSHPASDGTPCIRVLGQVARSYTATQRRRLIPH